MVASNEGWLTRGASGALSPNNFNKTISKPSGRNRSTPFPDLLSSPP